MKRIAILTSGGDAPGMNAALRSVTLLGRARGLDVVGVRRGYRGLLDGDFVNLTADDVDLILRDGGTFLGSARCEEFVKEDAQRQALSRLTTASIDGLVVIGGNGSLTGAAALVQRQGAAGSVQVIGIPASIDNDIGLTRSALGVDTALNTIVEACDKIADTASAHQRTFLIEVMGRECGYLAMATYVAVGADLVLFPEAEKSPEELVDSVVAAIVAVRKRRVGGRVLIVVAEGVPIATASLKELVDKRCRADNIKEDTRVTVLGHVVRGGRPSAFDRILGSRLGNVALSALLAGETDKMTAWMPPPELKAADGAPSPADPHCYLVDLKAALAETKRLLDGTSPSASWRKTAVDQVEHSLLV